jgi:hypothetical protein
LPDGAGSAWAPPSTVAHAVLTKIITVAAQVEMILAGRARRGSLAGIGSVYFRTLWRDR